MHLFLLPFITSRAPRSLHFALLYRVLRGASNGVYLYRLLGEALRARCALAQVRIHLESGDD
jgi:hypothetical protein